MKEKVIISVLCSILIIIGILNVSCGPVKKQSEVTGKNNRIVSEERYKVISDENDTYSFQAADENEPEDEVITLKLHALSARMIVNPVSMRLENERIKDLLMKLRALLQEA